jgi:23S rRNA (cytosine1962-C5)-methyltransferase
VERVFVRGPAALALRRGHPWLYRDAVVLGRQGRDRRGPPPREPESGAVVELADDEGTIGLALWDASSPIAARMLARGGRVDDALLLGRIDAALARRDLLVGGDTTALRWVHGEGDRLPGLVLDRYGPVAVLRTDGEVWAQRLPRLVSELWARLVPRGVTTLGLRREADAEGSKLEVLRGVEPPEPLWVTENGVELEVSVRFGQKTGAFLDQRDNRARVRSLTQALARTLGRPPRVLNLYSYTGGFSVAAALGGAGEVTSVDVAPAALAAAGRIFRRNGLDPASHRFVTADCHAFVERAAARGERWDLVVSDPPSFAPSERAKPGALRAYRRLHAGCARVVAEGGVYCAASCSSHVSELEFAATLDDETLSRGDLSLTALHGPPPDHPTLAAWPEGRYLKFAVLR